MPRLEHNGPNFRYRVFWRPKGSTYWNNTYVLDENANELEINVNDIYGLYEIKVRAVNDIGESYQPAFIILGHSGEAGKLRGIFVGNKLVDIRESYHHAYIILGHSVVVGNAVY
jgi:hypothetical protein